MTRKIRNRKTRNRKTRNRKTRNRKYANRKLIKNKRITRKKKTKTKQIGGFKQNGGKINFCYDSGDSGGVGVGEFKIVYLYTDDNDDGRTEINKLITDTFDSNSFSKKENQSFTDDYIKYFLRIPNSQTNKNLLESLSGLEDPDLNNFNGKNFIGKDSGISIQYYTQSDKVKIDIYTFNDNPNKVTFINNLHQLLKNKLINNNSKYRFYNYDNKVYGICKRNATFKNIHEYFEFYNPINCPNNNVLKETDNKYKNNNYVKHFVGLTNPTNSVCYANTFFQLLRNINNLGDKLTSHLQTLNIQDSIKNLSIQDLIKNYKNFNPSSNLITKTSTVYFESITKRKLSVKEIENIRLFFIITQIIEILKQTDSKHNTYIKPLLQFIDFAYDTKTDKFENKQQDSQEFLQKLNLDFLSIFHIIFPKTILSYNTTFLFTDINITQPETLMILKIENTKHYNDMQQIINLNFRAEKMDDYFKLSEKPLTYIKYFENPYNLVKQNTEYVLIFLKLFVYDSLSRKIYCNIKNIENNICLKLLPDDKIQNVQKQKLDADTIRLNNNSDLDINELKTVTFELISIVHHRGGAGGGHYVNYSKQIIENNEISWVEYNDDTVTKNFDITKIEQTQNNTPYLFLYKRLPLPTASA